MRRTCRLWTAVFPAVVSFGRAEAVDRVTVSDLKIAEEARRQLRAAAAAFRARALASSAFLSVSERSSTSAQKDRKIFANGEVYLALNEIGARSGSVDSAMAAALGIMVANGRGSSEYGSLPCLVASITFRCKAFCLRYNDQRVPSPWMR